MAERLRSTIREAVDVEGTEFFITASIGFSINAAEATVAADLLRDADGAMYRAKSRGRDCVEAYAAGLQETTALALRTATELRRGIDRGEIVPYYQPIVELTTGHVVGFEALARWLHPERGLLGPEQFLSLAEETGLVGHVGEAILRDGLAQLAQWRARDLPFATAYLAVNVGTRQVVDPAFAALVAGLLAETGIPADSLWLEITESALLADVKASTVAMRKLRGLGLHLAVDDFGTGYSSLTYLKRFPVEAIKIDRSFVAGLGLDNDDTTIVEAVVNLGHSSGSTSSPRGWRRRCSSPACAPSAATVARATSSAAPAPPRSSRASASHLSPALERRPPTRIARSATRSTGTRTARRARAASAICRGESVYEPCLRTFTASVVGTADSPLTPSSSKLSTRKLERSRAASSSPTVRRSSP